MNRIFICTKCEAYTMESRCKCGGEASDVRPPKYSPEDKYKKYRQEEKKELLKKEGLY